jgi:hypothetical protein
MATYRFHLVDEDVQLDLQVVNLNSEADVRARAEALARALLLAGDSPYSADPAAWEIRVTDENGSEVLALPLSEVTGRSGEA